MKILIGCLDFILQLPGISWAMEKILDEWQFSPQGDCPLIPDEGFEGKHTISNQWAGVALISYGARGNHLTNGSWATTFAAVDTADNAYYPSVTFGAFYGDEIEKNIKTSYISDHAPQARLAFVGSVTSTTDECLAILRQWRNTEEIDLVIVVAEGCHARRARVVWQHFLPHFFPEAKMVFRVVDARDCEDVQNPMILQRYWRIWLLVNILLLPFFKFWPGVAWFAKQNFAQPTGE